MKGDRSSLEPTYRMIRETVPSPVWSWPLGRSDRDPLDFTPRVLSDDEKVAEYLNVCRALGFSAESLTEAEAWFRENRL